MSDVRPVISVNDPAIDTERMTVREMFDYYEKRDWSLIAPFIKPDVKPQIYHVRQVAHALWSTFVRTAITEEGQWEQCFRAGVVEVENLYHPDGSFVPGKADLPRHKQFGENVLQPESLRRFDHADIEEIGAVVRHMSFLAARKRGPFPLPPMCLVILTGRAFRHADANPSSPEKHSNAASQGQQGEPTQSNAPSSGAPSEPPTVVTATGTAMAFESTQA